MKSDIETIINEIEFYAKKFLKLAKFENKYSDNRDKFDKYLQKDINLFNSIKSPIIANYARVKSEIDFLMEENNNDIKEVFLILTEYYEDGDFERYEEIIAKYYPQYLEKFNRLYILL
jgi:hypothetical protein